jgi:hypothetical protein
VSSGPVLAMASTRLDRLETEGRPFATRKLSRDPPHWTIEDIAKLWLEEEMIARYGPRLGAQLVAPKAAYAKLNFDQPRLKERFKAP